MTTEIVLHVNETLNVKLRSVLDEDGAIKFVLTDFAKELGYRDANEAKRLLRHSQYNTSSSRIKADLGIRGKAPILVTEGGLYRLALRSNQESAEPFQEWVEDEVLPSIRRDGGYVSPEASAAQLARLQLKIDYLEVTDLLTGARDYKSASPIVRKYFARMQNAFHLAVTGQTAKELIADSSREIIAQYDSRKVRGRDKLDTAEAQMEGYLGRIVVGELGLRLIQQRSYTVAEFVSTVEEVLREQHRAGRVPYAVPHSVFC